jgi:hypothetical protein
MKDKFRNFISRLDAARLLGGVAQIASLFAGSALLWIGIYWIFYMMDAYLR